MSQATDSPAPVHDGGELPGRWELIRDVLVFQLKLAIDAMRDVLLVPVSLIAGVADLVFGGERPGRIFQQVLALGRESEVIINLFGSHRETLPATQGQVPRVDDVVGRLEKLVVEQYERGGLTAQAKDAIDRGLDAIGRNVPR
jgi:hypothetical protein